MESGYYNIIDEVGVVLVDHETENIGKMVDLLKSYDYKDDISTNIYSTQLFIKLLTIIGQYTDYSLIFFQLYSPLDY